MDQKGRVNSSMASLAAFNDILARSGRVGACQISFGPKPWTDTENRNSFARILIIAQHPAEHLWPAPDQEGFSVKLSPASGVASESLSPADLGPASAGCPASWSSSTATRA